MFARIVYGGRVSLTVGIISAIISLIVGIPLGLLAGYFRGKWEIIVMRLADIFMSFPSMILILVLASVLGQSIVTITVVIGVLGWPEFARLIYASTLSVREKEYVESAKAIGTKTRGIIVRYIVPNASAPVIIAFTFRTAQAIITESSLSFLGLGAQPPMPEWGAMLNEARADLMTAPHAAIFPVIAIFLTVLAFNLLGDGLRDALDPKVDTNA